jgi:hypothetical protein
MDDKENERTTDKSSDNIQDINTCNVNILQENSTSNSSISPESSANTSTSSFYAKFSLLILKILLDDSLLSNPF